MPLGGLHATRTTLVHRQMWESRLSTLCYIMQRETGPSTTMGHGQSVKRDLGSTGSTSCNKRQKVTNHNITCNITSSCMYTTTAAQKFHMFHKCVPPPPISYTHTHRHGGDGLWLHVQSQATQASAAMHTWATKEMLRKMLRARFRSWIRTEQSVERQRR